MRLQPLVRARVESLGPAGREWADGLPALVDELVQEWELTLGRPQSGGSASYVVEARRGDGSPCVLKVSLPDDDLADEARTLAAADGSGYVRLLAWDQERRAELLESLGPSLERTPMEPEGKLAILAETLREAWRLPLSAAPEMAPGQDKASTLSELVRSLDDRLHACDPRALAQALSYADRLADSFDVNEGVVAHGDAQPPNLLQVRAPRAGAESGYVFVDPDGFRCDPCYDLGVAVRDWTGRLQGDHPRRVLEGYCDLLAQHTGLDRQRIWEWGFLERVSTGLYVTGFGGTAIGRRLLDSAVLLLDG